METPSSNNSRQTGLLSNAAPTVPLMQTHGLSKLAGNDPDFDHLPGLKHYTPA
ncbi:MAG TPA: hypothetical protein VMG10_36535 [Gemmataceae bacterium]|nr:hypothetical protein [Gemmataceae bacterium]